MKISDLHKDENVAELEYFGTEDIKDSSFVPCCEEYCSEKATCFTNIKIGLFKVFIMLCEKHSRQIWHYLYSQPDPDEIPIAKVIPYREDQWKIEECPYCLESHVHGADREFSDRSIGRRIAHCSMPFHEVNNNGYILKRIDDDDE